MLKVGLIGVGGISGAHIPAWEKQEETELVALCDVRPERMEKYGDKHCYTDFEEMLKNEDLDILDICLPTYLHAEYSIKAMEQGINVICEKPVSLKKEDVARVYDTAEKNNVKFMVAQVIRFWPEYCYIKELYDTKKYGKLLSGNMSRLGSAPGWSWDNWMLDEKRSGFVSYDLHIHDLDFIVYTFGEPKSINSFRSKRTEQDFINATYEYDGFFINTEASWYAPKKFPFNAGFRFQFENAVAVLSGGCLKIYEKEGEIKEFSLADAPETGNAGIPKSNAYANEIEYFTNCVINNMPIDKVTPKSLEQVIGILNNL